MKAIYTSENVKRTLEILQRRYSNFYNKNYSIKQIIFAFNKLPGRYQDLLLKPDKNENDKANAANIYDMFRKYLHEAKDVDSNIKIDIKNIDKEEEKKKSNVTLDDIESDKGDKWVRPAEKKEPIKTIEASFPKREKKDSIVINTKKKSEEIIKKEEKEISKVDILKEKKEEIKSKKEVLNERIKTVILEEYLEERQKIDIESILDKVHLDEDDKYIILIKYDNNSVKTNEEVSKETGLKTSYIEEVVERFFDAAIELKKKKIYKLEMEL